MLSGSELALDRAEINRSMTRESAIMAKAGLAGYKFIRLRLKDIKRKKIVGIDAIVAQEFPNESMGGITDYFIEVKGGEIDFKYRPDLGMYVFDMLDTDRNREFLASHQAGDYWEILDKEIEANVAKRANQMAERMRERKPLTDAPKKFWKDVRVSEKQIMRAAKGEVDIPRNSVATDEEIEKSKAAERTPWKKLDVSHETSVNVPGVGVVSP